MKKIVWAVIILVLFLTGCSSKASQNNNEEVKKQIKIEIHSISDNKLLKTIDNQDTVIILSETYNWKEVEEQTDDLVPEYKLLVYQEKTLLFGQDPNEKRDYELIETIKTFQNSSYIEDIISNDVIKGSTIPENAMVSHYVMPDDTIKKLHELLND